MIASYAFFKYINGAKKKREGEEVLRLHGGSDGIFFLKKVFL